MRSTRKGTNARRHHGGFTLVEITIVIGIIILLAGLTLAVSVSVIQGSEVRQTELTIRLLETAVQEWELQADRKVRYGKDVPGVDGERYEIQQVANENTEQVTGELLTIISRNASVQKILALIDPEFLVQVDDIYDSDIKRLQILDAWGQPIIAIFPGRTWDYAFDALPSDMDGTIRTDTESLCGIASNRRICFLSVGPDGEPGDLEGLPDSPEYNWTRDNLYSYSPAPQ